MTHTPRSTTYIIFVLLLAGCLDSSLQTQLFNQDQPSVQSSQLTSKHECLSKQSHKSCFYWKDSSQKKNVKLVIFVHGVFSNPSDTWGNLESGNTWPALLREDERFKNFDIYLFNYHTTYFTSSQMIHEIATREMDVLKDSQDFQQYNEIYFIAHSMGGLIVKSLLTHLNRGDDIHLLRRVKAVITLGTPSQGASIAVLGQWLSLNPQLKDMSPKSMNSWLSDMEKYWNQLMDDRKESLYPRAYCAYETRDYFLGYKVVPQEAAASRCDGVAQGLFLDHSQLAMVTSMDEDPYRWVTDKLYKTSSDVRSPNIDPHLAAVELGEPSILFECDLKPLPKTIPHEGNVMALAFSIRPGGDKSRIQFQYAGIPGEQNTWVGQNGYGYVCQLTNYGTEVALDLNITFGLRFREVVWKDKVGGQFVHGPTLASDGWNLPIRKLDTGPSGRFVFYLKNATRYWLDVTMPMYIELRSIRDLKPRKVPLTLPNEGLLRSHRWDETHILVPMVPMDWGSWRNK